MFDVSFGELAIIFVVALLVLGPEKLPKVAKTVGKIIGQLQQHASHLKQELAREGELAELRKLHEETTRNLQEVGQQLISPLHEAEQQLQAANHSLNQAEPLVHTEIAKETQHPEEPITLNEAPSLQLQNAVLDSAVTDIKEDSQQVAQSEALSVPAEDAEGQLDLFASQQPHEKHA